MGKDESTQGESTQGESTQSETTQSTAALSTSASIEANPIFVVGIGASAGGLEALEEFFSHTPKDSGMAYVVIQHLSPDFTSSMDQLLARRTELPIHLIEDEMQVEPDTIYLLPPKKEAILSAGKLLLTDRSVGEVLSFPIDHFFRSLAQDAGRYAIAVVLSGTGSDGSRGILDIHGCGGMVVAQSDKTAKFDGMPRSACDTGIVDMVLPPKEMAAAFVRYSENPLSLRQRQTKELQGNMEGSMLSILTQLNEKYGLDFTHYKTTTISRRIERRVLLTGNVELEEYASLVEKDDHELDRLYRDLLIGVTGFFRDKEVFERIELDVLPDLLNKFGPEEEFRAWVAGCASGEEAYSLAILLNECIHASGTPRKVKIFASDMHQGSLAHASRGVYQQEALAGVTSERLKRYFSRRQDGYHVSPELRKMVVFTPHNMVKDAPFIKLDLITCRNVMIYFTQPTQKKLLSLFHFGLKRDGILCLGASETPGDLADEFETIEERTRIYRKHRETRMTSCMRMPVSPTPTQLASVPPDLPALAKAVTARELMATYDNLLATFMPPSLLVSSRRQLLHTFEGANKYLRLPEGRPTDDVLDLVLPKLRTALSAALRRVRQEDKPVIYAGIQCETRDGPREVKLTVSPLSAASEDERLLIQFESEQASLRVVDAEEIDACDVSSEEFETLERELQYTKDSLQSTIEELQATNEELQSSNEQLTASNEELQSTNEELHSVNEELYTVNAEHQRKIDELIELTDDMDNLLNSTRVHTIFLDKDLCIRRFTPGIADTFNLIPQDVGRRIDTFAYKILDTRLLSEIKLVLETGERAQREVQDRDENWYLLRIIPYIARNKTEGVVVTLIDISSLKEAEKNLEELSEIVEHSDDAIYRVDLDGTIRTWNLGATKLYGYEPSQVVGQNATILAPAVLKSEPATFLERIRKGISVDHVETQRQRRNETVVDVSLTVSPIRDATSEIVGASVISRDITKQKQAEQDIREAVRRRDQFLAMLSHELRNPLAAVINATSLLREEDLDHETDLEARDVIERHVRHVARMLDDLLDVSRITHDKVQLHTEIVDINGLMMDVIECVQPQIDAKDQQLHVQKPDEALYVNGDVGRLQQAQVNILVNASKYTRQEGRIEYRITRENGDAVVHIRDNGIGIEQSLLDQIFEPFVQSDQTLDRSQGGMGLGLPLVRMIAEAHAGTVTAFSEGIGKGSEFTIRLPLTSAPTEQETVDCVTNVDGKKLLIVEDNPGICKMLARSMELKGFDVATANDGQDALDIFPDFKPDISVIDIGLPDLNGYDVARRIRKLPRGADTMLVALTGYGRESDRQQAARAGFDLHLVKPLDPNELLRAIAARLTQPVS